MHLVPAPAVRLMKRRVQSRPGARQENRFFVLVSFAPGRQGWDTSLFIESLTVGLKTHRWCYLRPTLFHWFARAREQKDIPER